MIWHALDLETATRTQGSICEVAIVEYEGGTSTGEFYRTMVRPPNNRYDTRIQVEYSGEDTETAPEWSDVVLELQQRVGNSPVVAHHAAYDLNQMIARYRIENTWFPENMYCSLRLARAVFPAFSSHKLTLLANLLEIETHGRHHTAYPDADACAKLFIRCAQELNKSVYQTMEWLNDNPYVGTHAWLNSYRKEMGQNELATSRQKDYIIDLLNGCETLPGVASQLMTFISNLTQISHFDQEWLDALCKNEASTIINLFKQYSPPSDEMKAEAAGKITLQPHIETEVMPNVYWPGVWELSVAGAGPVLLSEEPKVDQHYQLFIDNAGDKVMSELLVELDCRPV